MCLSPLSSNCPCRPEIETADYQVARLLTTFRSIRDPVDQTEVCRNAESFARRPFRC